jgi:hypothetical protein
VVSARTASSSVLGRVVADDGEIVRDGMTGVLESRQDTKRNLVVERCDGRHLEVLRE